MARRPTAAVPAKPVNRLGRALTASAPVAAIGAISLLAGNPLTPPAAPPAPAAATHGPVPLLAAGQSVDWWFAYKFSAGSFPGSPTDPGRGCAFGGTPQTYKAGYSQKYAVASSVAPALADGPGLIGTGSTDPLGATFGEIWSGAWRYVTWNDQFYGDPARKAADCSTDKKNECGAPWGHSKGIVAWAPNGDGVLIQVTTPSWPGSGSAQHPRAQDGNTLGCTADDNVSNAQDFFALRLNHDDVKVLLHALAIASVSTDTSNAQIVGGAGAPDDTAPLIAALGRVSADKTWLDASLSSGVRLIAKPSALHVPPWQFVSSVLGGEPLLTATWWDSPRIPSTRSAADVHCWDASLPTPSGEVDVATAGSWNGVPIGFLGGVNHAKIGVSQPGGQHHYAIFGDMNQQGQLGTAGGGGCDASQNGRGGMFFVMDNPQLSNSMAAMMHGTIAPYPGN